jgi:hypothetical protein
MHFPFPAPGIVAESLEPLPRGALWFRTTPPPREVTGSSRVSALLVQFEEVTLFYRHRHIYNPQIEL